MANRCSQLLLLLTARLFVTTIIISVVSGQSGKWLIYETELIQRLIAMLTGVTLSLNGVDVPNDGYVLVTDITEGGTGMNDGGLLCITDRTDCCRGRDGVAQGEWYFSNGSLVEIQGTRTTGDFFFRNRDARIVRLNRFDNPMERGRFRCEVANATGVNVTVYVNIGE